MPLSADQKQRIVAHLEANLHAGCPLCGSRNMSIEQDVQFLGVIDPEYKQPVEGNIYPVVSVTCDRCFHMFHLSAMRLGLLR